MNIKHVKACRKSPGQCSGCGKPIEIGQPYKLVASRFSAKKIKCNDCNFRPSELTTSKMGTVYDAQEATEKEVEEWTGEDIGNLSSALEDLAGTAREVAEEYQESISNMNNNPLTDEWQEKADSLESWADDLEGVQFEEYGDQSDGTKKEDWIEEQRQLASDAIEECP